MAEGGHVWRNRLGKAAFTMRETRSRQEEKREEKPAWLSQLEKRIPWKKKGDDVIVVGRHVAPTSQKIVPRDRENKSSRSKEGKPES